MIHAMGWILRIRLGHGILQSIQLLLINQIPPYCIILHYITLYYIRFSNDDMRVIIANN